MGSGEISSFPTIAALCLYTFQKIDSFLIIYNFADLSLLTNFKDKISIKNFVIFFCNFFILIFPSLAKIVCFRFLHYLV